MKVGKGYKITPEVATEEGWYSPNTNGGLCHCGCGEKTTVAHMSSRKARTIKGESRRYISGHNSQELVGEKSSGWKGGRSTHSGGYIMIRSLDHPSVNATGYIMEHRLVMEAHLGRVLLPSETVHHKNGQRDDNRIENLELRAGQHGPGASHCWHCGESLTPPVGVES